MRYFVGIEFSTSSTILAMKAQYGTLLLLLLFLLLLLSVLLLLLLSFFYHFYYFGAYLSDLI